MELDVKSWLTDHSGEATLLGICPMSESIVEAALREAAAEDGFVPMFIATPRQVDADRGYTGWSQSELVAFVEETADDVGYDGPTILARDHGGPYQSTRDRGDPNVPLEVAMEYAMELFEEDVESGFDLLHVDATEDATIDGVLDLEEIVRRTTDLLVEIETFRSEGEYPPVYYEVGTEEIAGGMTESDDFEAFIELLRESLEERGYGAVMDRILFVVGQVGTTMQIDMQNQFDPAKTRELVEIVSAHDCYLKVHYTDWLDDAELERFPELGIGAANVGPEFAAAIVEAHEELESIEREVVDDAESLSNFNEVLQDAAVRDAPWKKFAPTGLEADDLTDFADQNSRNIAVCVGRYVLNDDAVADARRTLYENLEAADAVDDPDAFVVQSVRETIHRYAVAFGGQDGGTR